MRNKFKYGLLSGFVGLTITAGILGQLHAQTVSPAGGPNIVAPARFQTYQATYQAVTAAASATDIVVVGGSATKTIFVKRMTVSGISTADGTSSVALIKRSTADTLGTPITPSATAGGQLVPLDSANAAATATVVAYSANPTTGTAVGIVAGGRLRTSVAATSAAGGQLVFDFSSTNDQALTLRGVAQQLALSGLGSSLVAGAVLTVTVEWLEQ